MAQKVLVTGEVTEGFEGKAGIKSTLSKDSEAKLYIV